MNEKITLAEMIKVQRKNIQFGPASFPIKFINPIDKSEDEIRNHIDHSPHLHDLLRLFDGQSHKRNIILCDDLNLGISVVGKIGKCMTGFFEIPTALESYIDFEDDDDDFYFDNDMESLDTAEEVENHHMKSNFILLSESCFDPSCDNTGDTHSIVISDISGSAFNYSEFENLIFICDGIFTLSEKSLDFLQDFQGNIVVLISNNNKNDTAIRQLTFESDFETFRIDSPSIDFLVSQFNQLATSKGYSIDKAVDIKSTLEELIKYRGDRFAEYDLAIYLDKAIKLNKNKSNTIKSFPSLNKTKEVVTSQILMDSIIGLEDIKDLMFKTLYKNIHLKQMAKKGHSISDNYKHIAFEGNPGSCKTTMARAVAKLYLEHDIVSNGFYEYGREDIVGRYVGETSQKVSKIFKMPQGGVMFIDEIGALLTGNSGYSIDSFGEEALNAIVRNMENYPETMVIIATYPEEMEQVISVNPGLKSRLSDIIRFPDYSSDDLVDIFSSFALKSGYSLELGFEEITREYFNLIRKDKNFGNGREARKLFENSVSQLSVELFKNKSKDIDLLTLSSINDAIYHLSKNIKHTGQNRIGFALNRGGE